MKMSSCPTDDIHSIYLDNELPPVYANQYEQHLKICPKCEAKLDLLKKNHFALQSDAQNIRLDKIFLDDSFERLKTKLRYSKNTDLKATITITTKSAITRWKTIDILNIPFRRCKSPIP